MADQAAGAGTTTAGAGTQAGSTAAADAAQQTTLVAGAAQQAAAATDKATGTTTDQAKTGTLVSDKSATTDASAAKAEPEIVIPKGETVSAELLGKAKSIIGDDKLTPQQKLQELVNATTADAKTRREQQAQQTQKDQAEQFAKLKKGWEAELKDDAVFGGKNFDPNLDAANKAARAAEEHAPGLLKFLSDTGLGSHPVLVKMLAFYGKNFADDKVDKGAQAGATQAPTAEQQIVSLFPKSGQKMIDEHAGRKSG